MCNNILYDLKTYFTLYSRFRSYAIFRNFSTRFILDFLQGKTNVFIIIIYHA